MNSPHTPSSRPATTRTYTLAELAPDLDAAEVTEWHVTESARVATGDDLLDVTTDKATITIPAPADGRVLTRHVVPGATVRPSDVIVTFAQE